MRRVSLGVFPLVKLADARARAGAVKEGVEPVPVARAATVVPLGDDVDFKTFGAVAKKYIEVECARLKNGRDVATTIRSTILPAWQSMAMTEIRKRHARELIERQLKAGKPAAAHRLHEIIKRIFNWSLDYFDDDEIGIDVSPVANLKPPVKLEPRQRTLSDNELKRVWKAAEEFGYPFGPLIKLLILLGQRREETAHLQLNQIDFDARQWLIPVELSKSKRPHMVPLSEVAIDIIKDLPTFRRGDYLFSTSSGARPISGFSTLMDRLRTATKINERFTLHDLRRTCRSGLSRLGVQEIVGEMVLNHAPPKLVRTYDVHLYEAEKREALQLWADHVTSVVNPPPKNVVKLTQPRSRSA